MIYTDYYDKSTEHYCRTYGKLIWIKFHNLYFTASGATTSTKARAIINNMPPSYKYNTHAAPIFYYNMTKIDLVGILYVYGGAKGSTSSLVYVLSDISYGVGPYETGIMYMADI